MNTESLKYSAGIAIIITVSFLLISVRGCLGGQGGQLLPQSTATGTVTGYVFVPSSVATTLNAAPSRASHYTPSLSNEAPQFAISPPTGYSALTSATVSIVSTTKSATTDSSGAYSITVYDSDTLSGSQTLKVEKTVQDTLWAVTFEVSINSTSQNNSQVLIDGTSETSLSATVVTVYGGDSELTSEISSSSTIFDSTSPTISSSYFPLASGYQWVYENLSDTSETRTVTTTTGSAASTVSGIFMNWFDDTQEMTLKIAQDKTDNVRIIYSSDHSGVTVDNPGTIMPVSPVADTVFYPFGTSETSSTISLVSTDNLTLSAGTFEGYIRITRGSGHYQYFVSGVGLVKEVTASSSWGLKEATLGSVSYPPSDQDLVQASINRWETAFEGKNITNTMAEYDSTFESDLGQDKDTMQSTIQTSFFNDGSNIQITAGTPVMHGSVSAEVEIDGSMTYGGNYSVTIKLVLKYKKISSSWKVTGTSILWQNAYRTDKQSLAVQFSPTSIGTTYETAVSSLNSNTVNWTRTESADYHYIKIIEYPGEATAKASAELAGTSYTMQTADFGDFTSGKVYMMVIGSKSSSGASDGQYAEYQKYFMAE